MLDLVNETVAAGKDVESSEDEFKGISDQIEQLNRRIAAIQESIHKDGSRQARLEEIQSIITNRNANETQYDDSIVRQMIECIKVHRDGRLTIIFGGGYEIEETLQKARSQDTEKTGGMRTLLQEFSLRGWYHILIPQTARRKQTNIFSQDGICQGGFL